MFSGGLDSTSILVATSLLERNVQPFTLALPGRGYDESQQAINICKELGLDLQVVAPNIDDILLVLPHIFDSMDVPIFDTAVVSNYLLCREISNHFKVTLSGDGGDEIFRGYSLYDLLPWLNFINRFFNYENTLWLTRLLKFLHRTEKYTNSLFKLERLNAGLKLGDFNPDLSLSPLAGTQLLDLIQSDLSVPLKNLTEYQELCYVRQVDNLYRKKIQPLVYLRKTDRMSMSNGLEVRNPFLDHRLLEFESGQGKLAVGTKKIILRDYCRKLIPDVLLPSKKHGFGFPVSLILSKIAEPDWILPLSTRQMKAVHETWIDATERRHANSAIAAWALLVLNEFAKKSARYITWL
jgi:asparagine synthase (glutamine-hydrolysing)